MKRVDQDTSTPRRVVDAAIILPVIGAVLVFVPLLWPAPDTEDAVRTSSALIYLFAVWAVMIIGAAGLSLALRIVRKRAAHAEAQDD